MRYFFHISFNGFNYRGWQKLPQTNGEDIQSTIERTLSQVLKTNITIVGCGRTDAQVHAAQFFFHADIPETWDYDLLFRLNKNLPDDISVHDIIPVDNKQHARFDATSRTYNYFIHTYKDPYLTNISSYYPDKHLDFDRMKLGAALLLKYDDYIPFTKNIPTDKPTICKVSAANLYIDHNGDNIRFEITSNRFLNGMIRIIVNKLLRIGRGELSVDEFESYLVTKQKPVINRLAYPQGLYLTKVVYPYLDLPVKAGFLKD